MERLRHTEIRWHQCAAHIGMRAVWLQGPHSSHPTNTATPTLTEPWVTIPQNVLFLPLPLGLCFCCALWEFFPHFFHPVQGSSERLSQTQSSPFLALFFPKLNSICLFIMSLFILFLLHDSVSSTRSSSWACPLECVLLVRYWLVVPPNLRPAQEHMFPELWTLSHLSLLSFFLFLSVQSSNLFKHHWIIPALGVNFFF